MNTARCILIPCGRGRIVSADIPRSMSADALDGLIESVERGSMCPVPELSESRITVAIWSAEESLDENIRATALCSRCRIMGDAVLVAIDEELQIVDLPAAAVRHVIDRDDDCRRTIEPTAGSSAAPVACADLARLSGYVADAIRESVARVEPDVILHLAGYCEDVDAILFAGRSWVVAACDLADRMRRHAAHRGTTRDGCTLAWVAMELDWMVHAACVDGKKETR